MTNRVKLRKHHWKNTASSFIIFYSAGIDKRIKFFAMSMQIYEIIYIKSIPKVLSQKLFNSINTWMQNLIWIRPLTIKIYSWEIASKIPKNNSIRIYNGYNLKDILTAKENSLFGIRDNIINESLHQERWNCFSWMLSR